MLINMPWGFEGYKTGTFAIFTMGSSPTATNRYFYSANASAFGTNLIGTATVGGAAGNSTLGVFSMNAASNKYFYASNAVVTGTNFTTSTLSAAGNAVQGVFILWGGQSYSSTNTYKYSTDSVSASANLVQVLSYGAAAGNNALGVFALGFGNASSNFQATNVYTYSTNSVVAGTNLTQALFSGAACGNSTFGVFAVSGYYTVTVSSTETAYYLSPSNVIDLYNYASNTVSRGTNLKTNLGDGGAAGNSTLGVFAVGPNSSTTNIYTYASNNTVVGTNLTANFSGGAAASNGTTGVNM